MSGDERSAPAGVYTIGHSNHPMATLIGLLATHAIDVVVDVRSAPYSRYAPQFNRRELQAALAAAGFKYVFMGKELGGRPDDAELYDERGHAVYSRVERSPLFLAGLARLEAGIGKYRVTILCSEENPAGCHRHLLIGHVLERKGIRVLHIRGDGSVQDGGEIEGAAESRSAGQLSLFAGEEVRERKSIRSVLPKDRPPTSSGR